MTDLSDRKEHLAYMDLFRGVSIVLIVLTHTQAPSLPRWTWDIVQNASVFFIFISGFFVRYLYRDSETYRSFALRKARRVLIPYLISCVPGLLLIWRANPESRSLQYSVLSILTGFGHCNDAHWFVPFIMLVFAAYPIWRFFIRNIRALAIGTCFAILISLITLRSENNANPLLNLLHFFGVFMAGMLAAEHRDRLTVFCRKYFVLLVVIGFSAWALVLPFVGLAGDTHMEQLLASGSMRLDLSLLKQLLLVLPLMAIFMKLSASGRSMFLLKELSRMSFGIFFWHLYVVLVIDRFARDLGLESTVWQIAVRPALVFGIVIGFLSGVDRFFPGLCFYFGITPGRRNGVAVTRRVASD